MKYLQSLILATLLLTMCSAFKLKKLNMSLRDNISVENRLDMPCAILTTQIYKAFQLYGLQTAAPRQNDFIYKGIPAKLFWNMCSAVPYDSECPQMPIPANYGYVKATTPDGIQCFPVFVTQPENSFTFGVNYETVDTSTIKVSEIAMTTKIQSEKTPIPFTTTWKIQCLESGTPTDPTVTTDQDGNITISFADPSACGQDLSKFILFFKQKYVLPGLLLILSFPLVFFGLKFIKKSLATIGFIAGAVVVCYFTTIFSNFMTWETKQWIIFALIALAISILVAVLCYNSPSLAIIIGGAALGYFGGQQLILLINNIGQTDLSDTLKIVVVAICILVGLIIGWKMKKLCIILATSLTGSYLFMFSLGSLIGNYPDMSLVKQQIKQQDFQDVSVMAWVYLGGTVLLFIIGASFQYRKYINQEEKNEKQAKAKLTDDYHGYN